MPKASIKIHTNELPTQDDTRKSERANTADTDQMDADDGNEANTPTVHQTTIISKLSPAQSSVADERETPGAFSSPKALPFSPSGSSSSVSSNQMPVVLATQPPWSSKFRPAYEYLQQGKSNWGSDWGTCLERLLALEHCHGFPSVSNSSFL